MPTTDPFPLQIVSKVNDPKILELIQQFGHQNYVDANDVKVLTDALNFLFEKSNISLVDGFYAGSLNPTDDAPAITGSFFGLALNPGTYTNFDNVVLLPNSIGVISKDANGDITLSQTTLNLTGYAKRNDLENKTEISIGENLVNPSDSDYTEAVILNGIGELQGNSLPWKTTGFNKVKPETIYTSNFKRYVSFYDQNKIHISTLTSRPELYFETPALCYYTRFDGVSDVLQMVEGQFVDFPENVGEFKYLIDLKDGVPQYAKHLDQTVFEEIETKTDIQTQPLLNAINVLEDELDLLTNDKYPLIIDMGVSGGVGGYVAPPIEIDVISRVDDFTFTVNPSNISNFDDNMPIFLGVLKDGEKYKFYPITSWNKTTGTLKTLKVLPLVLSKFQVSFVDGLHSSRYGIRAQAEYICDYIEKYAYHKKPSFSFIAQNCISEELQGIDSITNEVIADFKKTEIFEENIFIIPNTEPNGLIAGARMGPNVGSDQYGRVFKKAYVINQRLENAGVTLKKTNRVNGFVTIILGEDLRYSNGTKLKVSAINQVGTVLYQSNIIGTNQKIVFPITPASTEINFSFTLFASVVSAWQISVIDINPSSNLNALTPFLQKQKLKIMFFGNSLFEFPQAMIAGETRPLRADGSEAGGQQFISIHTKEYLNSLGYDVEVYNNSRGGQTSAWGKYWLKQLVLDLPNKPDYVFLDYSGNDANSRGAAEANIDSVYDFDPDTPWEGKVMSLGGVRGSVTLNEWFSNMKYISDTLIQNGIKPVILNNLMFSGPNFEVINQTVKLLNSDFRKI